MKIDVRFDAARSTAALQGYSTKVKDKALVKALNRAAVTVRSVAARMIAKELKPLQTERIKASLRIDNARASSLTARVTARGARSIPLSAYKPRQTKTGITVRVGGRTYTIAHAFLRKVKGQRLGVRLRAPDFKAQMFDRTVFRPRRIGSGYARKGNRHRAGGRTVGDYPIAEIFTPGIPTVFVYDKIMRAMSQVALERFNVVVAQEVKFLNIRGL